MKPSKSIIVEYEIDDQLDSIRKSLPCRVSEAFVMLGILFSVNAKEELEWKRLLYGEKLLKKVQDIANKNMRQYFLILFDDESPVPFKGLTIPLIENEDSALETLDLINNKISKIGTNVSVKKVSILPD